jgi:hypothetical protein
MGEVADKVGHERELRRKGKTGKTRRERQEGKTGGKDRRER